MCSLHSPQYCCCNHSFPYLNKSGTGAFNITAPDEVARVLGAEGCMWGERTSGANVNVRLWPRAAAFAEALWSGDAGADAAEAYPRLLRHRCRLVQRGVPANPLQPGFC